MVPPTDPDEFDSPTRTLRGRAARTIERVCVIAVRLSVYFAWLGFLTGTVACVGTGSSIGLAFLTDGDGQLHNGISILFSFVGFGFGAGLLRMTSATVLLSLI